MNDWSVEDWSRERPRRFWDPGRRLLRSIRRYQYWRGRGWFGSPIARYYVLQHRFWSIVTATDIPLNCRLGGGLLLPHPTGVVIHPSAVIGPNCLIFQHVTIGAGRRPQGTPVLGPGVDVGAGAVILGGVTIGERAGSVPTPWSSTTCRPARRPSASRRGSRCLRPSDGRRQDGARPRNEGGPAAPSESGRPGRDRVGWPGSARFARGGDGGPAGGRHSAMWPWGRI